MNCKEIPTFARFGTSRPSRCAQHKMPQMVKISAIMQAPEPKKKDKQVTFEKKASTGDTLITTGDILEKCPQSPPDESAVGHSLGELFGK